jgi:4-amino-4-deoxy-L-arabinose transferase-like glycosyltransferase
MSLAAGLSLGMLMLVKGTTVLLPPFLLLALLSSHYRQRLWRVIGGLGLMAFVAALVLSPWVIRNYGLTGKIIPLSTWGGSPFYQGYYLATHLGDGRTGSQLDYDGAMEARGLVYERYTPVGQPIDEYHRDSIAYALVWEKIRARPLYSCWVFVRNAVLVWFLTYGSITTIVSALVHVPLLLLAACAIPAMVKQNRETWIRALPLVLILIYFNLFHAIAYPHVRYMSPVIATTVTILAAYGISQLIARFGPLRTRSLQGNRREAGS